MHACGHDGHTAMLLGAAQLLAERRDAITGNVKLMFQPAEEGGAGAMRMIEDGVLEGPDVDGAFALHVNHRYYAGQVGIKAGPLHASSDYVIIDILGQGGHASMPDLTVDPIVIGAQVVSTLQTLVSREVSPRSEAVITIGSFHAGTRPNIIPDTAHIEGTIRTHSARIQERLERRIPELVQGIARAMRGDADVKYTRLYPVVNNDAAAADLVRRVGIETIGEADTLEDEPIMGGEDFAFILQRVPGAMFHLGVRNRAWTEMRQIHTARFELDEDALPVGAAMLAGSALRFLEQR
jgi:amidohydrolase